MLALRRVLAVDISRTFAPLVCSSNSIIYRVGLELLMGVRIVALIEGNDGRQVRVNGCSGDIGNIVGVMDIVGLLVCFGGSAAYMAITGRQHDARVSRKGSIYLWSLGGEESVAAGHAAVGFAAAAVEGGFR